MNKTFVKTDILKTKVMKKKCPFCGGKITISLNCIYPNGFVDYRLLHHGECFLNYIIGECVFPESEILHIEKLWDTRIDKIKGVN